MLGQAQLHSESEIRFVSGLGSGMLDLSLQHWTFLLEARPKKLCLFLDLEPGTFDLSLQHWTCLFEAGPSAQLHS